MTGKKGNSSESIVRDTRSSAGHSGSMSKTFFQFLINLNLGFSYDGMTTEAADQDAALSGYLSGSIFLIKYGSKLFQIPI